MASPTRRAPPAPLRPPARLGAAQRRSERSPVRAALAPPPPGPPRPRLAPPPPPGGSASPPSLPPFWGAARKFKKGIIKKFFRFFLFFLQGRRFSTFSSYFAPSSHSPAGPPAGLGAGVRGAGAAERGLKASQALQRPTRACTPPPVPAEKSSSYPRLHRSAFLFQSAGRLAAPPVSGQASCLERAPLHLLARLLALLPGRARQLEAGGGSVRDPACSRSHCFIPAVSCLLLLLLRFSNSPLSPLVCV